MDSSFTCSRFSCVMWPLPECSRDYYALRWCHMCDLTVWRLCVHCGRRDEAAWWRRSQSAPSSLLPTTPQPCYCWATAEPPEGEESQVTSHMTSHWQTCWYFKTSWTTEEDQCHVWRFMRESHLINSHLFLKCLTISKSSLWTPENFLEFIPQFCFLRIWHECRSFL